MTLENKRKIDLLLFFFYFTYINNLVGPLMKHTILTHICLIIHITLICI